VSAHISAQVTTGGRPNLLVVTVKRCTKWLGYAALFGLIVNVLYLVAPMYTIQVYDHVLQSRSVDTLVMLSVIAGVSLLFLTALEYLRSRILMVVGERVTQQLGTAALEAAVQSALKKPQAGTSQAMRDLQDLRQFMVSGPIMAPIDAFFAPIFMIVLLAIHPAYALISIVALILMVSLGLLTEFVARRPAGRASEVAQRAQSEISAAIRNAEVIEAMGMLPAISGRWLKGQQRALAAASVGAKAAKAIGSISKSTRTALSMTMLGTGVMLTINGWASPGSMMAASLIMGRLLFPFEHMIDNWRQWSHAIAAFSRLKAVLAIGGADRGRMPVEVRQPRLNVEGVTFVPPGADRAVLKGVRFALEPGDVLGIAGPSGAGKSTLARLLVGVWRPTTGGVYFDGHDVYAWERESFGRQVGYLPQNAVLLDGTVRDNIARFGEAKAEDVIDAARKADIHELIGRLPLGYETSVGETGFTMSGGQRQRVALARALFGAPKLLVLDEPNANTDAAGEQALMQAIREAKADGATVIIIAHRMSVMAVADKLLVLKDGVVDKFGPRADVLRTMSAPVPARGERHQDPKVATLPFPDRAARA
jgi:ATP-binding cassette subfamily C protein